MNEPTTRTPLVLNLARSLALGGALLAGGVVAFVSQASSPDYRALWWSLVPWVVAHVVAVASFALLVPNRIRWVVVGLGVLAMGSFVELTLRTWM